MKTKKTLGKRLLSLLLTLLMVLSLMPLSAISAYAAEAPVLNADGYYEIETYDDLCWYRDKVNSGSISINAILMNDIVVNENVLDADGNLNSGTFPQWDEIGDRFDGPTLVGFHGIFDGNGKTISGVYNTFSQGGFFRQNYGTIKNLNIVDSYFRCSSFCGSTNYGTIINCSSSATINGDGGCGGFSQYNGGTIESCTFTGKITTYSDAWAVGGICGRNSSVIKNCYSSASISGTSAIGGISGGNSGTVENCYSTGTITIPSTTQGRECYGIADGTVVNSYYIDTSMNSGGDAVAVSQAQFESGEVAYMLGEPWGQKIGTDKLPILGGDKVYKGVNCDGSDLYGNTLEYRVHNFINGFCPGCDGFEPATDENSDGVYEISNAGQLYWFADKVSNDNENFGFANAILTADIVINEGEITAQSKDAREWTPIGTSSNEYSGIFDGNNHYISGLYFNSSNVRYVGLIGCLSENGVVKNIGLINSYIYGSSLVGGVVGYNRGTVTNCYNEGTIGGYSNIGGVVGNNRGTVTNCYNVGWIDGYIECGAVVGFNNLSGVVQNCYYNDGCGAQDNNATSKTIDQFKFGEVAYLLQGDNTEKIWGQRIGTDIFPILGGDKVYFGYITCDEADDTIGYTNIVTSLQAKPEHDFVNGFCTVCDMPCEHNWDDSVCTVCGMACEHNWDDGTCTVCGKVCEHNWYYGTCEVCGKNCNHPKCEAEFSWDEYSEGTCYASVELTCADCQQYVDSYGDYAELDSEVEAIDCQHPGSKTYTFTYEYNGEIFTGSKTFEVKSDNHIGELTNGFCSECGGYEAAKINDNGTPDDEYDDYYEISNAGQLYWFKEVAVEKYNYSGAVLTADIIVNEDLSAENLRVWDSIGDSSSTPYCGTFNGQGHTISGLYAKSELNYVGLFGAIGWGARITNLGVTNSYFEGKYYVAGIVGYSDYSYVTNCYVDGVEVVSDNNGGALVGYNYGEISNSYSTSDSFVGNNNYGTITNCYYLSDEEIYEEDGLSFKTAEQFKSGEVAYLLQSGVVGEEIYDEELGEYITAEPEEIWGQKIGTDVYPVLGGDKVFEVTDCKGNTIYSNKNENDQHNYENGFCTVCGEALPVDKLAGYSLSLGDKIAVNYHVSLTEKTISDENAKMVFTVPDSSSTYTVEIPVKEAVKAGDYYVFTCRVAAKEMTCAISAKLITSDSELQFEDYSVVQYAEYILEKAEEDNDYAGGIVGGITGGAAGGIVGGDTDINNGYMSTRANSNSQYIKAAPLVKAMLNYGANAQLYFDYNTDNLANASLDETDKALVEELDLSAYESTVSGEEEGVSFYGGTLSLKSETAIKLYFEIDSSVDMDTLLVTVNDENAEFTKNGKYYELKISDIPAHKLQEMYEVKVGELTVNYGVFSYGTIAMGTNKDVLKNTIKSLYAYNLAARYYLKPDCDTCGNTGTITSVTRCNICNGAGSVMFTPCDACLGDGTIESVIDCPDCSDDY